MNFRHGGLYIDSPDWTKKKKATMNPKNIDDSFRTENKLKNKPLEKDNMSEFNQNIKSDKMPYIIHADIKSLIKKDRLIFKQSRKTFNNKNR